MGDRTGFTRLSLGLTTLAIVLAACGGGDESPATTPPQASDPATATPSAAPAATPAASSPAASAAPSPGGTAGTDEPTVVLDPDTLAEVIITEMVVRSAPRVADDSEIFEPVLGEGQRLLVLDGPEPASGYWWYLVKPIMAEDATVRLPFGWVSSSDRDGEPWLEPVEPECPSEPAIEAIAALSPEERLVCFGGDDLTFTGQRQQCGTANVSLDPSWFQAGCAFGPDAETTLFPRFPPDVEQPAGDAAHEITGHFDDPRAQDCVWVGPEEPAPPTAEEVIVMCRLEFVVVSAAPAS